MSRRRHRAAARVRRISAATLAFVFAGGLAPAHGGQPRYEVTSVELARIEPRMQREIASLQYLLNAYQLRQFMHLENEDARRAWIARFWKSNDPTPATPENEMRTEHYLRTDIARAQFARSSWPGWDKRGEVLIRYGFPDYRGEIESEVTSRGVHPPGELWYYRRHQMIIRFSDINLNGDYSYAITPLGDAQDVSTELAEFLVYDTKESIQEQIPPQYLDIYRAAELNDTGVNWGVIREQALGLEPKRYLNPRMTGENEDISAVNGTDWERSLPDNPSEVFQKDKARELAANFEGVLEDTPSSYPFNFERKSFPFYFDVEQFRGGEGVNRIEVNLELLVQPTESSTAVRRTYQAQVTVMDENYKEVDRQSREISLPVSASSAPRLMPAQIVFSLPRSYYRIAVSARDVDNARESAYRTNVSTRQFDGDLAISDVLFAQKVAPITTETPFARGPIEVVPHPIRRYAVGTPVTAYFELYNLGLDEDGRSNYDVAYRVLPHTSEKESFLARFNGEHAVFSSTFKGSGYSATEPLHIAIRSENLKPGFYDFMVTVKDQYWQSTVQRQGTFRIVEPSEKTE